MWLRIGTAIEPINAGDAVEWDRQSGHVRRVRGHRKITEERRCAALVGRDTQSVGSMPQCKRRATWLTGQDVPLCTYHFTNGYKALACREN